MILVTGGAGYVGSVLVRQLLASGHRVRVLDKLYFGAESLAEVRDRIELVQKDLRDIVQTDLDGVTAVVHMGGLSNDPTAEFRPAENEAINAQGTLVLGIACAESGCRRLTYASTASVYDRGTVGDPLLLTEDDVVDPKAAYARSKLAGEEALQDLADRYPDFCPVILRQGTVYGWSPRMRFDLVVNTFVQRALTVGVLTVLGGGRIWRPLVSVNDAARAHVLALEAPSEVVRGQVFNIVERNYQILELAHRVRDGLKKVGLKVDVEVDWNTEAPGLRDYRISGARARQVLGFHALDTVEEQTLAIAGGIKRHPELLQGKGFVLTRNIDWMRHLVEMEEQLQAMGGVF